LFTKSLMFSNALAFSEFSNDKDIMYFSIYCTAYNAWKQKKE
jgi:hypothetical protein